MKLRHALLWRPAARHRIAVAAAGALAVAALAGGHRLTGLDKRRKFRLRRQ